MIRNKIRIIELTEKISFFSAFFFLVLSCVNNANRKFIKKQQFETYDAVIVPGVPFEKGEWSDVMKLRVYWSVYLYKKGIAKNIIYSGSAVYSPYIEAKIMAIYAEEIGIPKSHIFVEAKAEHSTENLYYSYKVAQKNGFEKVALATDPFQNSFLKIFAKKTGLDTKVDFIPASFDILDSMDMPTPLIDPSLAFVSEFVALPQKENFVTRWRGTMGKYIKYEKGDDPKSMRKKRRAAKKRKSFN